jgi:hypothetical protein
MGCTTCFSFADVESRYSPDGDDERSNACDERQAEHRLFNRPPDKVRPSIVSLTFDRLMSLVDDCILVA